MRTRTLATLAATTALLTVAAPAQGITGGQPDGNGHPYAALLLVPGETFCSGTLIDEDVILTAGHCTWFWDDQDYGQVLVSFDPQAEVTAEWTPVNPSDWVTASDWSSHPLYVDAEWPFTYDYGLLYLDDAVEGITPAALPGEGLLDELIGDHGQTPVRFLDVGYGIDGVVVGDGRPVPNVTWTRKVAVQRYRPGQGAVSGVGHPTWFSLGNVPSAQHGSGCGGDSGSGIFPDVTGLGDTVVAVHTGGFRLGADGAICGRITSLNHRVDIPEVLDWILADAQFLD